ncbi:MAG: DUF58 domain-containing protein [Deltaproteobacteria bacterium]|nr:DUF58 domain-containing protein [Deltaproteobacteria bacterium]
MDKEAQEQSHRDIMRAVRRIEIATRRAVNSELAGRYQSVFKGQGMAFSEVRPYAPGDDIRHIDWNVTARHQKLFVKQFIEEREQTVMLLVDLSASGLFGTRRRTKRRLLAEVSGLLAFSAISNNDRVGLLLFSEDTELFVPPRKGRKHVLRVVREIIEAEPSKRGTNIGAALAYLSRVQKRRAVTFLLSDFLDDGFDAPLKVALARHDVIAMRVTDPAEIELPNLGIVEVVDLETGTTAVVDSASARVRAAYAAQRHAARESTKKRLNRVDCDLIELSTDQDYVAPLVSFFRMRARRLRGGRS